MRALGSNAKVSRDKFLKILSRDIRF